MSTWYTAHCEACDYTTFSNTSRKLEELTEDERSCEFHETPMTIVPYEELQDIDMIVEIAGSHLEDSNHHSLTHLPAELWDAVKNEVSTLSLSHEKQVKMAKSMMKPFFEL